MATREELKAEVERIGRDHGHTLGIWLVPPLEEMLGRSSVDFDGRRHVWVDQRRRFCYFVAK